MVEFFRRSSRKSEKARPAPVDPALDIAFYRSFYPDVARHDDAAVALHWHRHGKPEHRAPNAFSLLSNHPNFARLPADFDPVGYVFINRDVNATGQDGFEPTLHFLEYGMAEGREHRTGAGDKTFIADDSRRRPRAPSALELADARLSWSPKTIEQYLYLAGFTGSALIANFDVDFYYYTNELDRRNIPHDLNHCLFHFVEEGVNEIRPISDKLIFDPNFYRSQLRAREPDAATASDSALYKRWLSLDDFPHVPANHLMRMDQLFGVACDPSAPVGVAAYRRANRDLHLLTDNEVLEHLFGGGLAEQRSSIKFDESNIALFTLRADRLLAQGHNDAAEALYARLAHFMPKYQRVNQHLGDVFFRKGAYASALGQYKRNIDGGKANKWAYLHAATCCERLDDLGCALAMIDAACLAYPDDQGFVRVRQTYRDRFFTDEFGYARALTEAGDIRAAQTRSYAAAARCDTPPQSEAPSRPIRRVALFANMDLSQCTLYRVEQKAEQLIMAGFEVCIFNWSTGAAAFERDMMRCDAVIFYRVAAFPNIVRIINAARAAGLSTFYEIDDLLFDGDEYPEPIVDYAGQITPFDHADLCMGVPLFRYAMGMCDYAIASTPALARRMAPIVRKQRAFVHRNALGLRHERVMGSGSVVAVPSTKPVTIFFGSGTKAHKLDFEHILLPALEEIDRRFGKQVRFVFAGFKPAKATGDFLSRATFTPFSTDVEDYWAALRGADIALSVLRRTPATDAKSEIKWLEAAMFGIPSVVSATETFAEVIEDGVDGFLARSTADFVECLSTLVRDKARRTAMGQAAKDKAIRNYGLPALTGNIRDILQTVVPQKAESTRVLIVHVFYPPQAKGGATRVVYDNVTDIRALYPDEFEFEVFTTLEGGLDPYSVEVSAFDGVRVTSMVAGSHGSDLHPLDERVGEVFRNCVERFQPHLIHFHCIQRITVAATEVAMKMKIPYVITAHDGWWISDRQFIYDAAGHASRYDFNAPLRHHHDTAGTFFDRPLKLLPSLRGAAAVLAVSEPFADVYRSTGLSNVRAVPNGVPQLAATPTTGTRRGPERRPGGRVSIAHIGGTEAHKGLPFLKYAIFAAKPKNLSMLIVELALEPGEERFENWNGTPVRFIAKRPQNQVQSLYDEIDVLFAPSLWPESYGLVTREALAAGCWVVASDRGAVGEPVIDGVNGHVVSVDTLEGLVAVVKRIDADPTRYMSSPPPPPPMRTARDQAEDLADLYRDMSGRRHNEAETVLRRLRAN